MAERIAIGRKCPTIERWRNQGKRTAFNFAITDAFAEKVMQSIDKRIEVLDEKKTD